MEKRTKLRMSILFIEKQWLFLIGKRGRHEKWLEKETECGSHVEETDEKCWSWRTNVISWSLVFGMHSTRKQAERNCYQGVKCSNHDFLLEHLKNIKVGKNLTQKKQLRSPYDMVGHAQKCVERYCELANKKDGTVIQSLKFLLGWSTFQERGTWIGWRVVKSMLANCLDMLLLGTNWWTWHCLVSKQACSISHQMDRSLWRTFCSFDFTHSSHTWLPDNIVMWVTRLSIVDWVHSKTQTLLVTFEDSKSISGGVLSYLWKVNTCS